MTNILSTTRYVIRNECLISWVEFFWHIKAADANTHYKPLPADCTDVVLNLVNDMVYETECNRIITPPFHINELRSKYSFIHQEKNICILGISFYPHGLYPFVHKPLKEVQNKVVNLNRLSCSLGEKLKRAVSNETIDKTTAEIESALTEELSLKQDFVNKA